VIQFPHPIPLPGPWPVPVPQPGPVPHPAPAVVEGTTGVLGTVGTTGAAPASPGGSTGPALGPAQVGDWKKFLMWLAALAALWLILTAAQDAGYPEFANGMAGLILFGSVLALGPKAITNAKLIFQ
jgi:hypothetical protein